MFNLREPRDKFKIWPVQRFLLQCLIRLYNGPDCRGPRPIVVCFSVIIPHLTIQSLLIHKFLLLLTYHVNIFASHLLQNVFSTLHWFCHKLFQCRSGPIRRRCWGRERYSSRREFMSRFLPKIDACPDIIYLFCTILNVFKPGYNSGFPYL